MGFRSGQYEFKWNTFKEFWLCAAELSADPSRDWTDPYREEDLQAFEAEFGYPLPALFKQMMAYQNGGIPEYRFYPFFSQDQKLLNYTSFYYVQPIYDNYFEESQLRDNGSDNWFPLTIPIQKTTAIQQICLDYRDYTPEKGPSVKLFMETELMEIDRVTPDAILPVEEEDFGEYMVSVYYLADSFDAFVSQLLGTEEIAALAQDAPPEYGLLPIP